MRFQEIFEEYRDQVQFLNIYIREAHPIDGWWLGRRLTKRPVKRYAPKVKKSRNFQLASQYENGMGIHHAGMLRSDRKLTEQMFSDGAIKVLCCTATLAWGM